MTTKYKKHLYGSLCTIVNAAESALNGCECMILSDCLVFPWVHPTAALYRTDLINKGKTVYASHDILEFKRYPDWLDSWCRVKVRKLVEPNFKLREEIINEMKEK